MGKWKALLVIIIIFVLILAVLILGIYGEQQAQKEYNRCTLGIEDKWCWLWETNVYDDAFQNENLEEPNGGSVGFGG